jgi:hypothetical protein
MAEQQAPLTFTVEGSHARIKDIETILRTIVEQPSLTISEEVSRMAEQQDQPLTINVESTVDRIEDIEAFQQKLNPILRNAMEITGGSPTVRARPIKHIKASFSLTF